MTSLPFERRFSPRLSSWLWLICAAAALVASLRPFAVHVEYFGRIHPWAPTGLVAALVALAAGSFVYARFVRPLIFRWELPAFALTPFLLCLVREPLGVVGLLAILVAAFSLGDFGLRKLQIEPSSEAAHLALACALGFSWLSASLFAIGLLGGFRLPAFLALLAACYLLAGRRLAVLPRLWNGVLRKWRETPELQSTHLGVALFWAYLFLLFGIAVALTPAINEDAMRNHLADVARYIAGGELAGLRNERFSFMPKAFEVLLALAEGVGGRPAAEMLNPVTFLLTLLLGYSLLRSCRVGRAGACFGVVAAACVPFFHWTGVIVKNDFLLALYQTGALYCWIQAREQKRDAWLYLSVLLLAASFGVKHTAAFGGIPIAALYLWSTWRRPRLFLSLAALGLLSGFYWHVWTFIEKGSPVYPFLASTATKSFAPQAVITRPPWWTIHVSYPWIVHFAGQASFEGPSMNPVGMFLVFAAPVWLLLRRRVLSWPELVCLGFCLTYYLYWGWIWGVLRYFLVPFLLGAGLTAARLFAFAEMAGPRLGASVISALIYCFAFATPPTMMTEINAPQLRYLAGRLDRPGYLREAVADYRALEWLRERWESQDTLFAIASPASVYTPDPWRLEYSPFLTGWNWFEGTIAERARPHRWVLYPTPDREGLAEQGVFEGTELVYEDEGFSVAERR